LNQGADLFLNVTVKHPGMRGPYRQLALTTIFPSGWEILNRRLSDMPDQQQQSFDYQDIRDDRVYTYFGLSSGESRTFRIALNAAYKGRFYRSGDSMRSHVRQHNSCPAAGKVGEG
jgi:alpha-2-macroglobulin